MVPGRIAPFQRMSNRPGIGAGYVEEIAQTLLDTQADLGLVDVPRSLRHGDKELPLGPYLRKRLRRYLGRSEETPKEVMDDIQERLWPLYVASRSAETSYSKILAAAAEGQILKTEARVNMERSKL